MPLIRIPLIILCGSVSLSALPAQTSPVNRPWPAGVQKVSELSPPLSPAEALKTFYMPPGYSLDLVASEPLVRDPIAMEWDTHGRLWVVEMPAFLRDFRFPEPNLDPICRIVVLEDTNHTGRMNKRTVFADGLVLPRTVKVLDQGVLVGEPPYIWLMHDLNGDLHMHTKELVSSGFGRREGNVEENANGFTWGLDNWIHTAGSEIYLRLKNGKFEVRSTLVRGEWGASQDDAGRIYRNSNESPLHVDFVPTPYYARNPSLLRTRGSYDTLGVFDEINTVWPVRPNPGTNRAYQIGIDRPDGSIARYTSACAPLVYRGDRLPAELYGNVFVAEPAANLVTRSVVADDGTTLRVHKAYARGDFLASTDERFRPVFLSNAPDGTLYIVDMYRGVIQERSDITQYLRGQITQRHLEQPIEMGRIYRVRHESMARDESPALAGATPQELVQTLSHPNGWRRDRAQQLLVERREEAVVPSLEKLAAAAEDPRTRLHALWTLDGLDHIQPGMVISALADPSPEVRASAVRLAERWLVQPDPSVQAAVLKRLDDGNWFVREQLAASLGTLPAGAREPAVAALLERRADDPVVVDAALSGIRGSESDVLGRLLGVGGDRTPSLDAAIVMLAATVVGRSPDAVVQALLARFADKRLPEWQRSALLRGAEVTLLGAEMPGTVVEGGDKLGDRQAPGGAYAFVHPSLPSYAPAHGRRFLRLRSEPESLTQLAAGASDLGKRAAAVLARVTWPGKPGSPASVAPLTPEQEVRFAAGGEVYKNICQACHQPDGRGQERMAANLIDSQLALAPAAVTARILLNGKEGAIGLMPPVGAVLSDEQIAAVLTYIRREWGQTGSPVDPATVKAVRALTAGRQRAWTNGELLALPEMGHPVPPGI
jgi:mono/diheme cytochrome c family protein/glucose/arabinose dehydrogenase